MIRIPKPIRDLLKRRILAGVEAALDELLAATDEDSDGGRRITTDEARVIAKAAFRATFAAATGAE